nr:MAG TPA: hypothetical protein [Caudoviricetes sp.]
MQALYGRRNSRHLGADNFLHKKRRQQCTPKGAHRPPYAAESGFALPLREAL